MKIKNLEEKTFLKELEKLNWDVYTHRKGEELKRYSIDIDIQTAFEQVFFERFNNEWQMGLNLSGYVSGSGELEYLTDKVKGLEEWLESDYNGEIEF